MSFGQKWLFSHQSLRAFTRATRAKETMCTWSKEKDHKQLVHSLKIILVGFFGFVLNNHTDKVLDFHCFG